MRDAESLIINESILIEENIEVNIPRTLVDNLPPTHDVLDILELI